MLVEKPLIGVGLDSLRMGGTPSLCLPCGQSTSILQTGNNIEIYYMQNTTYSNLILSWQ